MTFFGIPVGDWSGSASQDFQEIEAIDLNNDRDLDLVAYRDDDLVSNSAFGDGDWNGGGEFNSSDLILAFQAGHYEEAAQPAAK